MKRTITILLKDKALLLMAAAILCAFVFIISTFLYTGGIRAENEIMAAQLTRIQSESAEIINLKRIVASKEKKASARSAGIVPSTEKMLKGLGLKAAAIKPLGEKKVNEFREESAEVEIKEADLNRIVNLLFMIETSGAPIKIKDASLTTEFEDPDKFTIKMTVSRLRK